MGRARHFSYAALVVAIAVSALGPVTAATGATLAAPHCGGTSNDPHHCFVTAEQKWTSPTIDGIGGYFTEPRELRNVPSSGNSYSIGQLWLESETRVYAKVIEFGWIVDPKIYHNHFPHLFLDLRWVSQFGVVKKPCFEGIPGNNKCPNGTYVQLSKKNHPGMAVGGALHHGTKRIIYHIGYYQGSWWIQYGSTWMGRVDANWWTLHGLGGGFAKANIAEWFGEVASDKSSCVPMGTGYYGTRTDAAQIANMFYEIPNDGLFNAAAKVVTVTDPRYWNSSITKKGAKFSSFKYGGPNRSPYRTNC